MAKYTIHLLGSISSGKGHTCKLLQNEFGNGISIIGLGALVRERLNNDKQFHDAWAEPIKKGLLLPDEVVCPMLNSVLLQPLNDIVVIEGFDRTPDQLYWSFQKGLMGPKSLFFRLNASEQVCLDRHQHRNQEQPDGPRTDTGKDSFHRKYLSFVNHIEEIDRGIRRFSSRVISIDANGDIPKQVFPQIKAELLKFMSHPAPTNERTSMLHSAPAFAGAQA